MATQRLKVLLAEDNAICREVAVALLRSLGCEVDAVENGRDAVERAVRDEYDAVFLDIQMPVMNGIEAARRIHEQCPGLPLVALTASVGEWTRRDCDEAGVSALVPKPIVRSELAALLSCFEPSAETAPAAYVEPRLRDDGAVGPYLAMPALA